MMETLTYQLTSHLYHTALYFASDSITRGAAKE
jgi:hypothetical protein